VRLSLIDVSVDEVAQAVRNAEADIGICTEDVNALDLQARPLYEDRLVLACLESHSLATRQEVRWSELAGEPLVLMRRNTGLRKLAERGLSATGDLAQAPFEVANVTTAVGLVEAGLGVSILPSYALTRTRAVGVRSIPLTEPVIARAIVALNAPERPLSGAAEAFLAYAQQSAQWGPAEEKKRRPKTVKKTSA